MASEDEIPEPDPNETYEVCPSCNNEGGGGCMNCWDLGVVPHACGAALA